MERPLLENESLKDMAETEGACRASGVSATGARDVLDPEVAEKPKRRRFSAEYRLRIVQEADACKQAGEIGALLRREGLYSSLLTAWRRQRHAGALAGLRPKKRGPKAVRQRSDGDGALGHLDVPGCATLAAIDGILAATALVHGLRGAKYWTRCVRCRVTAEAQDRRGVPDMTPRELIDAVRERSITLRVVGDVIKARHLRAVERKFLKIKSNARAVAALLALEQSEPLEKHHVEQRSRYEQHNLDVMAQWDETKVNVLAEAGQLTAEDIALWRKARRRVCRPGWRRSSRSQRGHSVRGPCWNNRGRRSSGREAGLRDLPAWLRHQADGP